MLNRKCMLPAFQSIAKAFGLVLLGLGHCDIPYANAASAPQAVPPSTAWVFVSHDFSTKDEGMPYVGNGYFSQRIPPSGAGFLDKVGRSYWPTGTEHGVEALVAGLYSLGQYSLLYRDESKRVQALIPTWTTLDFSSPSGRYTASTAALRDITGYRQAQDLRTGSVTTSGTWTAPRGETTSFEYRVFVSRTRKHVGVVSLTVTPHWSGSMSFYSFFDGAGAARLESEGDTIDRNDHITELLARSGGTHVRLVMNAHLLLPAGTDVQATRIEDATALTAGERITMPVSAGHTYRLTKIVALATSKDSPDPSSLASGQSALAAAFGADSLLAESRTAWDALWKGDIVIDDNPTLQNVVREGIYNLYASMRDDAPGILEPSGLSNDSYAGMAFWDSDTWMMPALLATNPSLARPMVDFRFGTLAQAMRNAAANGHAGAFYPWTAADDGSISQDCYGTVADAYDRIISDPNYSCSQEIHLQADIALGQWQYYLATGDRARLASRGYPVLSAIANYFASVAKPAPGGAFSLAPVQPPDEDHHGVSNSAYTNAAASEAIRHAIIAAGILGTPVPRNWAATADGLVKSIPFDAVRQRHLEYDGYNGSTIKQADVVLMTYPLHYPMPTQVALNDIDYYVPRTRANGPAMTDAIHSIVMSALDVPGCAAYTFTIRSYLPQLRAPFFQTSESTEGGAMNFLTGTGGLLQQFLFGYSGLRFDSDAIELDPSLPPQITGLTLKGLHWQGRLFTLRINRSGTTATLMSGAAMPIRTRQGSVTLDPGKAVTLMTRTPDTQPTDNLARCQAVEATSAIAGNPAVGAVDGSMATSWAPVGAHGALTIELKALTRLRRVEVTRGPGENFNDHIDASADGRSWWPLAPPVRGVGTDVDTFEIKAGSPAARVLRVSVDRGTGPTGLHILEVSVNGLALP